MKKAFTILVVITVIAIGGWYFAGHSSSESGQDTAKDKQTFDKQQLSLTDPASLWVIANKHNPLNPKEYEPSDLVVPDVPLRLTGKDDEMLLRKPAADALKQMAEAAKADNLTLMVSSAYRSYNFQTGLYNGYVKQQGQAEADTQSARPGVSEHQTGLAVDVEPASRKCEIEACFADTPEGQWIAANAFNYGFIIRYPDGQQSVTGYIYEPWHLRYVGTDLATELKKQHYPTLEKFFGLEAAPDYL
jgi:zinc D-Ala-D-Ala carboxypeptidase